MPWLSIALCKRAFSRITNTLQTPTFTTLFAAWVICVDTIMQLDQFHCVQGHQLIPHLPRKWHYSSWLESYKQGAFCRLQLLNHNLSGTGWKMKYTVLSLPWTCMPLCNMEKPSECINHCLVIRLRVLLWIMWFEDLQRLKNLFLSRVDEKIVLSR